jgi:hypothetical protein
VSKFERREIPYDDGAPVGCAALVNADSGPPDFGWRRCGQPATHILWDTDYDTGQPRCSHHDDDKAGAPHGHAAREEP